MGSSTQRPICDHTEKSKILYLSHIQFLWIQLKEMAGPIMWYPVLIQVLNSFYIKVQDEND